MTRSGPPSALPEQDYDAIEDAVMETARGRWFLAEYARRNRNADTEMLLAAIAKLQKSIGEQSAENALAKVRRELLDMAEAIAEAKREIATMRAKDGEDGQIGEATLELDAIVESTEKATSEILFAAEQVQEIAWSARESGTPDAVCDAIDTHVTEIYTACSFQDLTGQRTQKVVKVLRFIENRLSALVSIWNGEASEDTATDHPMDTRPDAHLLNGPQLAGRGTSQDEVNQLLLDEIDFDDVTFAAVDDATASEPAANEPDSGAGIDQGEPEPEPAITESAVTDEAEPATQSADADVESATGEAGSTADAPQESDAYDIQTLEAAAENAVALPPSESFHAFPDDGLAAEKSAGAAPEQAEDAQAEKPADMSEAESATDSPVTVPSLHDLAFNSGSAPAASDSGPKAEKALQTIADDLERSVTQQESPVAVSAPTPRAGDDLDSLTTNQRIVLFS